MRAGWLWRHFGSSLTVRLVRLRKRRIIPPYVLVKAVDNGPGGTDAFIATVGIGFPFATAPDCTRPFPEVVPMPLVTGDIIVHDAPPLPTSKEQCKNGGWRNFPEFENQGECVSFVATGAKKPPTG